MSHNSQLPQYFVDKGILKVPFDSVDDVFNSGNMTLGGNGYLGFRGTHPDWGKEEYMACTVSDTFDNADGKWKELCTVPNALYAKFQDGKHVLNAFSKKCISYEHFLDSNYGITSGKGRWLNEEHGDIQLSWQRFASYKDLHLVVQQIEICSENGGVLELTTGIDTNVWSLNGNHFHAVSVGKHLDHLRCDVLTVEKRLPIYIMQGVTGLVTTGKDVANNAGIFSKHEVRLAPGEPLRFTMYMTVFSQNDTDHPEQSAEKSLQSALDKGFDFLLTEHKEEWDQKWAAAEIGIGGDAFADNLLRYNMYHNFIATPAHTDSHPIGARGLSCQAYQGAAFWDQEIYNLPMFLYTQPQVAKNLLTYRHKVIAGAKAKAKALGYAGAYYPWISGDTGEELCPDYFFIDVISKRRIRNHFNDWQIHISPDISYTLMRYYESTGDFDFLAERGAEILLEVAHFLHARVHYNTYKDRYEILRVLGPDEYHENADNNTFTNVQAKYALQKALEVVDLLRTKRGNRLEELLEKTEVTESMLDQWKDIAHKMYIPQPDPETHLIPQFDGYFELEDIRPMQLAERLLDESEYWGWPNGIAYETQVIKQADVIQLFVLHEYERDIMDANYHYYEPRTHHRSSLSPGVHAIIAAQIGNLDQAYRYYLKSSLVDISNSHPPSSGGTFIGGVHTAACGIAWQIIVFGFAGFKQKGKVLQFQPSLPDHWTHIHFRLMVHGKSLMVHATNQSLTVTSLVQDADFVIKCFGEEFHLMGKNTSKLIQKDVN